jgi:hypothetical protein
VTSELGGIAEWAREGGGEDEHGGNGADDIEGGGFNRVFSTGGNTCGTG